MPGTIVIAAIATGVQPANALFVGGTNVLKDDASGLYGVPLEDIEVIEAGPGGVSSCTFPIDDPTKVINIADGMTVLFWNYTADVPKFRGYVDHWSLEPAFGGVGRVIQVSCTGVEAWLDWAKITDDTLSTTYPDNLAYAIAQVTNRNAPQLRAPMPFDIFSLGVPRSGNFTWPIGNLSNTLTRPLKQYGATPPPLFGLSLREAIKTMWDSSVAQDVTYGPLDATPILVTVDFYMQLRVWRDNGAPEVGQPEDYTTLTIKDDTAGTVNTYVAEGLKYSVEPGDPIRAVSVKGGNAAGTGTFSDGTGLTGRTEIITDTTILDAFTARNRAVNLINTAAPTVRGSFTLSDFAPATTIHAGSYIVFTDAAVGLSSFQSRIFEIRKTFNASGRENWTVAFGGAPPSAARLLRKLTKAVAA